MDKKSTLNLTTIKRISIITDILSPVALYFALIKQFNLLAWGLLGIVIVIRLALVIVTR